MSTIVAISTAPAIGGIGIIKLSGKKCFEVLDKIFIPKKHEKIEDIKGYQIKYGKIVEPNTGKTIDEVLVSYFKAPKSYTAENMCEINSHGNMIILKKILNLCLENGAVLAEAGEFTKRAFLNGRIDLTQAEAIIDIINAGSAREAQESANQLEGFLSKKINNIKAKIMELMVDIEANIDYPEYDLEEVSYKKAIEKLENVEKELLELEKTFENGKIIKEGIKIAIIGSPNAGKSSLLNAILREERAIVTDIAGTTRDTIEESAIIEGIPFRIVDTAGIRETENMVEQIGIEKSKKAAEKSDVIVAVFDNNKELDKEDKEILKLIKDKKAIIVLNKTDLKDSNLEKNDEILNCNKKILKLSMKTENGLKSLFDELIKMFELDEINSSNELIITNIRHKNLINNAALSARKAINDLKMFIPIDIVSISIKQILEDFGEIVGDNVSEDIINSIFSKFCLGK